MTTSEISNLKKKTLEKIAELRSEFLQSLVELENKEGKTPFQKWMKEYYPLCVKDSVDWSDKMIIWNAALAWNILQPRKEK